MSHKCVLQISGISIYKYKKMQSCDTRMTRLDDIVRSKGIYFFQFPFGSRESTIFCLFFFIFQFQFSIFRQLFLIWVINRIILERLLQILFKHFEILRRYWSTSCARDDAISRRTKQWTKRSWHLAHAAGGFLLRALIASHHIYWRNKREGFCAWGTFGGFIFFSHVITLSLSFPMALNCTRLSATIFHVQ